MPLAQDLFGNPTSVHAPQAIAALDDFALGLLRYEARAARILGAAEAHPDAMLIQASAAMLWMFLESPDAATRAEPFLVRARGLTDRAHDRERSFLALIEAWADQDIPRVLDIGQAHLGDWPRDLIVLKLVQYHLFNVGAFPAMLEVADHVARHCDDWPEVGAMRAFGLEQCHRLDEAEEAARAVLALRPGDPWAQHAIAHVMLTQARLEEGAAFLASASDGWQGLNSFMSTHAWWHLGLFLIALDRHDEALSLHDGRVWGVDPGYSQDQVGAVSYLARLEFAGIDVGTRWDDLAPYLATRAEDTVLPFLSLQYLYGLERAGHPAGDRLHSAITRAADHVPRHDRIAWREVALPAAEAIRALVRGRPSFAADTLARVRPNLERIGGSHAQRDLFDQLWVEALVRAGRKGDAHAAIEARRRHDPIRGSLRGWQARL